MKILFYINILSNGGAERVISTLANNLSEDNEVIIVNSFRTNNEYFLKEKINHLYLDNNIYSSRLKKNINRIYLLRRILKKEKPDIAVAFMAEPNFRLLIAGFGLKTKTVISIRNDPEKEYPSFFMKMIAKTLFCLADGIVFQTKEAQKWFPNFIQKKSKIIFNPVADRFYGRKRDYADKHGLVMVGRLTEQKNYFLAIDAMKDLKNKISDNLYIYGAGEMEEILKQYIYESGLSERVYLLGNHKNIADELDKYKLFLMTSDYEGMPNSLMEAMAEGMPCISSDCPCGGPRELLDSRCLFPVENKEKLIQLILDLINDKNKLLEYAVMNQNKAKQFSENVICNCWLDYFKGMVS